ncbi:MAG TPA: hypothetical protein VNR42_05785 [Solirubrobacteraceae bacterium]|nr:hypothetical protein [Solirubrobacteraceae bacterium]
MAADTAVMEPPEAAETAAPVKAPEVKAAKEKSKAEKGAKDKKGGKDKKGKGAAAEVVGDGPSVAAHPRASRSVARAKSWGGLVGFLVGGYLSLPIGTLAEAAMRALVAGVVCYVAVWAGAVFVWRRLVILEVKAREQQLLNAIQAAERPGQRVA